MKTLLKKLFLSTSLIGMMVLPFAAVAEDCHRGTLDKRYCDIDRDLVADLPLDSSQWQNPSTIIFSYTPVEDPAVYAKVWDGFVQHLSKVTGKKSSVFPGAGLCSSIRSYAFWSFAYRWGEYRWESYRS